jgi:sec-independent protein translocase protein TatA
MMGLGIQEILILLVIFLLLFGAKRLPQMGEGLGKTIAEIRTMRKEKKTSNRAERKEEKGGILSELKNDIEGIPGLKQAKDIQKTAAKLRSLTKILK